MISNSKKSVRQSLIHFATYLLLLAGIVFMIEITLILLGVGDVFLPWIQHTVKVFQNFF